MRSGALHRRRRRAAHATLHAAPPPPAVVSPQSRAPAAPSRHPLPCSFVLVELTPSAFLDDFFFFFLPSSKESSSSSTAMSPSFSCIAATSSSAMMMCVILLVASNRVRAAALGDPQHSKATMNAAAAARSGRVSVSLLVRVLFAGEMKNEDNVAML